MLQDECYFQSVLAPHAPAWQCTSTPVRVGFIMYASSLHNMGWLPCHISAAVGAVAESLTRQHRVAMPLCCPMIQGLRLRPRQSITNITGCHIHHLNMSTCTALQLMIVVLLQSTPGRSLQYIRHPLRVQRPACSCYLTDVIPERNGTAAAGPCFSTLLPGAVSPHKSYMPRIGKITCNLCGAFGMLIEIPWRRTF